MDKLCNISKVMVSCFELFIRCQEKSARLNYTSAFGFAPMGTDLRLFLCTASYFMDSPGKETGAERMSVLLNANFAQTCFLL